MRRLLLALAFLAVCCDTGDDYDLGGLRCEKEIEMPPPTPDGGPIRP